MSTRSTIACTDDDSEGRCLHLYSEMAEGTGVLYLAVAGAVSARVSAVAGGGVHVEVGVPLALLKEFLREAAPAVERLDLIPSLADEEDEDADAILAAAEGDPLNWISPGVSDRAVERAHDDEGRPEGSAFNEDFWTAVDKER